VRRSALGTVRALAGGVPGASKTQRKAALADAIDGDVPGDLEGGDVAARHQLHDVGDGLGKFLVGGEGHGVLGIWRCVFCMVAPFGRGFEELSLLFLVLPQHRQELVAAHVAVIEDQALPRPRHLPRTGELAAHERRAAEIALVPPGLAKVAIFEAGAGGGGELAELFGGADEVSAEGAIDHGDVIECGVMEHDPLERGVANPCPIP
jgi:hypothetical protein